MFSTILMKELKDILRDKRSITLLIFIPLVLMTGLTFFYDKILSEPEASDYVIAVDAQTSDDFIQQMEQFLPQAEILKQDDLKEQIENKEIHVGITVDPNWEEQLENHSKVNLEVTYDPGSQKSSEATSVVMSALTLWESSILQQRLQGANIDPELTEVFQLEEKPVKEEDNAIASFMLSILIPILIPIAIANGAYPSATELFAGEKEKKTIEALLITPVKPIKVLLAKWVTISLLGIFTGLLCIGILILEIQFTTNLKEGLAVITNPLKFVMMSIVLIILFAIAISAVEMILSMMANSVKEAGHYITPVLGLLSLPILFMFFLSEALNIWLYAVPVVNLFLFVRDTFSGQMTMGAFGMAVLSYVLIIAILFPIANKLFHNHRLMLGK